MKFLFLDTYYPGFLKYTRSQNPGLKTQSFKQQLNFLLNKSFGTSNFYSKNLKILGHSAEDFILNDKTLYMKWAKENKVRLPSANLLDDIRMLPLIHRFIGRPKAIQEVSLEKIKASKPDVVYVQDLSILNPDTIKEAKKHCKIVVGQIASPMPSDQNIKQFDLILTSFPHFVTEFRKMGVSSEYLKLGFEASLLKSVGEHKRIYDVTFIGSISPHHHKGTAILEEIAASVPINFWGQGAHFLPPGSPLKNCYKGEAWGLEMYKILAQSKIVINRHIATAKNNANNMRLYESTGMGALLLTDEKTNLGEIFKRNKEVVSYRNTTELISKIKYYLLRTKEREKIANAGQKRTLKDHNYLLRMKEMVAIVKKYM